MPLRRPAARRNAGRGRGKAAKEGGDENPFNLEPLPGQQVLGLVDAPVDEAEPEVETAAPADKPRKRRKTKVVVQAPPPPLPPAVEEEVAVEEKPAKEGQSSSSSTSSSSPTKQDVSGFLYLVDDEAHSTQDSMVEICGAETVRDRAGMFAFNHRSIERIHKYFGEAGLAQVAKNLGSLSLFSLYSGLGGAEIAASLTRTALCDYLQRHRELQIDPPAKPKFVLACDFNSDCQKVLKAHQATWL